MIVFRLKKYSKEDFDWLLKELKLLLDPLDNPENNISIGDSYTTKEPMFEHPNPVLPKDSLEKGRVASYKEVLDSNSTTNNSRENNTNKNESYHNKKNTNTTKLSKQKIKLNLKKYKKPLLIGSTIAASLAGTAYGGKYLYDRHLRLTNFLKLRDNFNK